MTAVTSMSTGLYPIANTSSSFTGCEPCLFMSIYPAILTWGPADSSIAPVQTVQVTVDPNRNTTITSTLCNSSPLTDYQRSGILEYGLDANCTPVVSVQAREWGYETR